MSTRLNRTAENLTQSIDEVVATACNLAATDEISTVHVVSRERPTYDDLLRYRRWADVSHLNLSVEASSISFRSRQRCDDEASVETVRRPLWPPLLIAHVPWRASLDAYSQGAQSAVAVKTVSSALDWISA